MQRKQLTGPTIHHMELSEGMDQTYKFTYVNESTLLPVDLTGWTANLYVTYTPGHPQVLRAISSSQPSIWGWVNLGADGAITIEILSQFSTNLSWSDGFYDLVLTSPDQRRVKLLRGKVNIYNTVSFPLNYLSTVPEEAMVLTVGYTVLPNEAELWGYMNPILLGVGGGLYLTGNLRPTLYNNFEIAELSYSSGHLRIAIVGNVPDGAFTSISIENTTFQFSESDGRVFSEGGSNGLGLTYWEWTGVFSPFGTIPGVSMIVSIESSGG